MYMELKLERNYNFLRRKYNELLLPTLFMVMSEKMCTVIDVVIIGFFLGSTQMSIINLASPLTYATGIFYILFGQGGNLLALRAQSQLKHEKTNFYFTVAILGICLVSIIYILLIFLFMDNLLVLFKVPSQIYGLSKEYLSIFLLYYPLNCYLLVISFFVRSDGHPKMPFYAILMANIINIFFDLLFLSVFHWGISSTALASVLGYLIGAIYISTYLFNKNSSYKLISLAKFKIKEVALSIKEFIFNTPEVIGKIFFASKISLLTYLCSNHYAVAGLLAFLVYDNSESFVYIVLSGIMKTMSPIVTVLYKEMDLEAVHYIIVRSFKQILLVSFPISLLFFVYPEILLSLFNITDPQHIEVVTLAIRITSFSLVGRCLSYLLTNYAQAIEQNKIASVIAFLEEFLFAVAGALILTHVIGGVGIWISILFAESIPILIYFIYILRIQKTHKDEINNIFMLQNSNLITWTYYREEIGIVYKSMDEEAEEVLARVESLLKDDTTLVLNSMNDICVNIFENVEEVNEIDVTLRLIDDAMYIVFTSEGRLYNPFLNEDLMKSDEFVELSKLNCRFDYEEILGFNKTYFIFNH